MTATTRTMIAIVGAMALTLVALPALAHFQGKPEVRKTDNGKIITNPHGTPLYTYANDPMGESTCTGQCAKAWPPELASEDAQPSGDFSLVTRPDGSRQWAYEGKPLYGYRQDERGGMATGDGIAGFHVAEAGNMGMDNGKSMMERNYQSSTY